VHTIAFPKQGSKPEGRLQKTQTFALPSLH